ncbi:MAG: DUF2235 domain-containing protein [Pseudomonadota bacterium]
MPRSVFGRLFRRPARRMASRPEPATRTHVILLDGTMSSLEPGWETSIGLIYRYLDRETRHDIYYEPGIEWRGWRNVGEVMAGVGINHQIRRSYGVLAERWRPGDRIFLMGFSRGAYAVRALAGMIDRVGLLRPEHASDASVQDVYDHYRQGPITPEARSFAARFCHSRVEVTAIGVFDTVQAVGIRWPLLWRLFPVVHAFRSHRLGQTVGHGFHALALDETRLAYRADRWRTRGARTGSVEQVWFRGTHGDIGGQVKGCDRCRPLANVPLVWMLERLSGVGLDLPGDWRVHFPCDAEAPSVGNWRGFGKIFLTRARRKVGMDPSEAIHPTAEAHRAAGKLRTYDGQTGIAS